MRPYSDSRQSFTTAIACVAIGIVSFTATFDSLAQKSDPPIVPIVRTLSSANETPLAASHAAPDPMAAGSRPRVQDPCNDFEFSFLNAACAKIYTNHAVRDFGPLPARGGND